MWVVFFDISIELGRPKMDVEITRTSQSHPELVSGSGRGRGKVKARGEMLKRVQHDRLLWAVI